MFYKCNVCGRVVEEISVGKGKPICCGEEMHELPERFEEGNKHVPVITYENGKYVVKVGNVEHPMEKEHYIPWIEISVDGRRIRKYLKPGEKPEARFKIEKGSEIYAREFCTLHGVWTSQRQ